MASNFPQTRPASWASADDPNEKLRVPTYSRKALHLTPSTISRPHLCGNASLRQMHPHVPDEEGHAEQASYNDW